MNKRIIIIFSICLIGFTVYIALDTFVIKRRYAVAKFNYNDSSQEEEIHKDEEDNYNKTEPVITDNSYSDGDINITITVYREYDTDIYVADIMLSSLNYLRTRFAEDTFGKNIKQKTSDIAEDAGAVLAINGDYYGSRENGYVIRNGVIYRDKSSAGQYDLVIYNDGRFGIVSEKDITAQALIENGARDVFSFGPGLISEGRISVSEDFEVDKAMASNPRTAIGQIDGLHYVMVVSDGRTGKSEGLSLYELAEFMQKLGTVTAYNLDGGGSSTMYFNGNIINNPVNHGSSTGERKISDIVYIGR